MNARRLPSFDGATGWLNSPPLTPSDLRGKVVLVNFWTYTCINWLRQMPYIRAWADTYAGAGLVVIGVHTPEFGFEHNADNVRRAVEERRISYPVAIDSDYAIWRAFDNHYWPAIYLADADGTIRHHRFGEGDYEQSKKTIQQLLGSGTGVSGELIGPNGEGVEAPADWANLRTPENYTGYGRTEAFASPGDLIPDRPHEYEAPARLRLNHWALSGQWTVSEEASTVARPGSRLAYRFRARDVHAVLAGAKPGTPVRLQVRLDGQPPGDAHGLDVDAAGHGTVTEQRLHQLIRQPGPVEERTIEITFLDAGLGVYAFTFG
jgi:thiol-disulfide isomerase/thioredoxin